MQLTGRRRVIGMQRSPRATNYALTDVVFSPRPPTSTCRLAAHTSVTARRVGSAGVLTGLLVHHGH